MRENAPSTHKSFPTPGGEEILHEFQKPLQRNEKELEREADSFATAIHHLINEKMFGLFLRAITEKETSGSSDNLAFLQNRIVQECIDLSEEDTILVLKRFNRSVREWFLKKYSQSEVDSRVYNRIISGTYAHPGRENIDIVHGAKSVISFLKTRARLLETKPAQNFNFYFSSKLDARHSIDVIEEVESRDGPIVSLFQIKSSVPSTKEIEKIHRAHSEWVSEGWTDLLDYENSYAGEGSSEEVAEFLKNKEKIEETLLEFCTDPKGQSLEKLLNSLHLSDLNHRQQAWVLWKYIDLLKEQLETAVQESVLDEGTKAFIWNELSTLKDKLVKKANLPKSQTSIKKVTSIISVGAKVFSQREIKIGGSGKVMNIR